ncbi:MAG TPA: hypothetical protein VFG50_08930, partial [Rhodothermales bacterium]|nr:hypothetical protein [Rhodothermales bacterium]
LLLTSTLLAIALLTTGTASAQRAPAPEQLLRAWLSAQAQTVRQSGEVSFTEEAQRVLDGPFGKRTLRVRSRRTGDPGTNDWERDILAASANGRVLTPSEFDRLERLSDHLAGARVDRLLQELLFPARALARMQPVGPVAREKIEGVAAWRFDVARTRYARAPVQRMTIWIGADRADLLHTRTILERTADGSTLTVDTDYERVQGLDVPTGRHIEGTIRTRRRIRTFTLLLRVDSDYSDYRIDRK